MTIRNSKERRKALYFTPEEVLQDVSIYIVVVTGVLLFPTLLPRVAAGLFFPALAIVLFRTKKVEASWINPFEIGKLIGGLMAIISLGIMQLGVISFDHRILYYVLMFNMAEAVVTDVGKHGWYGIPNALAGIIVMSKMPRVASPIEYVDATSGILHFNTPWAWVVMYSIWNATFARGFGYSPTTQLVLIPPIVICALLGFDSTIWIVPRAWSLLTNMGLRASQLLRIYTPGESALTKLPDSPGPKKKEITQLGVCSLLFVLGMSLKLSF